MLKSLFIKNFALIDELRIEFSEGLNIITGETGAGKSIIVNALAQLCGERSSSELIRKGAAKAILEAEIEFEPRHEIAKILQDLDIDSQVPSTLILRKEISAKGNSRTFVNDTPVSLGRLNEISSYLIDIHGQHQHQRLLHPENHLEYLDAFARLNEAVRAFGAALTQYRRKIAERDALRARRLKSTQLQDMYRFQMEELRKAQLQPGELDELYNELKRLNNIEYIHQLASNVGELLYLGEPNASGFMADAEKDAQKLAEFDHEWVELNESLSEARATIEEIGRFASDYLANLEFDPQRLEQLQERIAHLEFLLKKYQKKTVEELIAYLQEIENYSADMEQFDEKIQQKEQEIGLLQARLQDMGKRLSQERRKAAAIFEERIDEVFKSVGMAHARFRVRFEVKEQADSPFVLDKKHVEINERGFDGVVFELASNAGEDFKPLHKIASGGEISRIMLALKSLLAAVDRVPSMVFDEIDAGISGKIAQVVGRQMARLSRKHQILCITHLPQIAAFARTHFKVSKNTEDNHTFVDIEQLDDVGRVHEIATLLSGKEVAEQTLENARHLIAEAQTMK